MNKLEKLILGINLLIFIPLILIGLNISMIVVFLVGGLGVIIMPLLLICMIWGTVNSIRIYIGKKDRYKSISSFTKLLLAVPLINVSALIIIGVLLRVLG